ncbi:MAG: hypothetical protein HY303_01255 [Candidatus Wallbacteria bacterium]|nr:hypothetical protein [Candidatus Wallbacteria bacterium]
MLHRKLLALPLACALSAATFAAEQVKAVMGRDAELVIESAPGGQLPIHLEQGRAVWILPEMSNDRQLYIASSEDTDAGVVGWVDREAVRWPDGTPVPGNSLESMEPPRPVAQPGAESAKKEEVSQAASRGRKAKKSKSGHGKKTKSASKTMAKLLESAKVQAKAHPAPSKPAAGEPAARTSEPDPEAPVAAKPDSPEQPVAKAGAVTKTLGIPEMLLGLVTDAKVQDYARTVAREPNLSKEEKVMALKIFHKYLLERRSRLAKSGNADAAEREQLQKQSEDLLANLSSLEDKPKTGREARTGKRSQTKKPAKVAKAASKPKKERQQDGAKTHGAA